MSEEPRKIRFIDAFPRPLLIIFALAAILALTLSLMGLLRPPSPTVALQDRRPPPRAAFTHDVGAIAPGPLPSVQPTVPPPCEEVRGVRLLGGGDAVARLTDVLKQACSLAGQGVSPNVALAARALHGATIRFGGFDRTGVDSTLDLSSKTLWLNIKFALHKIQTFKLVPIVLHEAFHLAQPNTAITATKELEARAVEWEACRLLVPSNDVPRWCLDAKELTEMPRSRALDLLVSAGYERGRVGA